MQSENVFRIRMLFQSNRLNSNKTFDSTSVFESKCFLESKPFSVSQKNMDLKNLSGFFRNPAFPKMFFESGMCFRTRQFFRIRILVQSNQLISNISSFRIKNLFGSKVVKGFPFYKNHSISNKNKGTLGELPNDTLWQL